LQVYLEKQKLYDWKILLPGLVSQARSQATSATHSQQGEVCDRFDQPTFIHHLINFVVADDQVCVSRFWLVHAHQLFPSR
jgi:hypothetical protein